MSKHFQMAIEDERRWVMMLIQIEKDRAASAGQKP